MKLYVMHLAPNARRVRIFLAEKGVEVEQVEVDIASGANRSPDYLAVNPRGLIPALRLDDGTVIDESVAICRYFEGLHPEPNLMGRDAKEAAIVECWQRRCEFDGLASVASVFRNVSPNFVDRATQGAVPDTPQIPALAERGRVLTMHFLDSLERRLGDSSFVAGARFSIADITAFVTIDFAKWVKIRVPETHAATRRWYEMVASRPSSAA